MKTDVSLDDWGAFCQGQMTRGQALGRSGESLLHPQILVKGKQGLSILVKSDNITTVSHLNKMVGGGAKFEDLTTLTKRIWGWCLAGEKHHPQMPVSPRLTEYQEDYLSRHLRDRTDWSLHPLVFSEIIRYLGQPDVDATRFTSKVQLFYSWKPEPEALATDAFAQT